ncbi:MAG: N-acetyl-alpha-D-glucosaminyl L-malate synthase BshA [Solitalea-like symbiont of Acarus siro]
MKVGVICYPTYGGSGTVAVELGKAFAKVNHEVHFFSYEKPRRLDIKRPNIFFHKVQVLKYDLFKYPSYDLALVGKIVEVVTEEKLDILHAHYAIPHAHAAFIAQKILYTKNIKIPFITTLHGTDVEIAIQNNILGLPIEFDLNMSNGITSVSENLKHKTLSNFDIRQNIEVIPNFIDLDKFKTISKTAKRKVKEKIFLASDEKILIHVSNFRSTKRVLDVIKIAKKVMDHMHVKLLMIGDGPDICIAKKLSEDLNISDKVFFCGNQNYVEKYLSISDLFLLPSEHESFGLAALEAMACGVPIISTNIEGIPEVNKQGQTGFLSNLGDINDMAEKAMYLLNNNERLCEFKKNAASHAKTFNIDRVQPIYEKYYTDIINQHKYK